MTTAAPTRNLKELARLGAEAYDRYVRPSLRRDDDGKIVAIDVVTGEFEMDQDDYKAVSRLLTRLPSADIWLACVGQPTTCRMG